MTRLGGTLTLLRQPEPTFKRTRRGEFDTGMRQFLCHASRADLWLENLLVEGATDEKTLARAVGGPASGNAASGYKSMIIIDAEKKSRGGNEAMITVQYAGLMRPKADAADYDTDIETQAPILYYQGASLNIRNKTSVPKPTVTHYWTTDKGRPNLLEAGAERNPPGISAQETARLAQHYDQFTADGQTTIYAKWVLLRRSPKSPGGIIGSKVWKVTDTYQFVVIRVKL